MEVIGRDVVEVFEKLERTKMQATIGRIVLYELGETDAMQVNRRRTNAGAIAERIKKNTADTSAWPIGAQAHFGNHAEPGQIFPMIVTKINADIPLMVSGQVFLDGNDVLWVRDVPEGRGPMCWSWPPRV